jgi:CDP-glucose 4,6-dehydratase
MEGLVKNKLKLMSFFNIYKGKKVIVTGHTGFKGSWLSIWLKQLGADVYGYALDPYSENDNFVKTGLTNQIHHQIGDVRNGVQLKAYFQEIQPDFAFHLAAQPLVLLSYQDPQGTFETNLLGVINFLEAVRSTPSVKVAVNVTSDKCYDNKEWIWGYRENDAMGGKDPYSASKGCAELITASYIHSFFSKEDSCLVASARAGNVIGGGDWAADRIVPDFFRAQWKNEKLYIRNPYATRPWEHVLEPLSGYLTLASKMFLEGRKFSGGWNFGPEDAANFSVQELIDAILIEDNRGGYSFPENLEKPHEATLLKLDISKAVGLLKWKPTLSFTETVQFTVQGYSDEQQYPNEVYQKRIDQILHYTELARLKNIQWSM